MDAEVPLTLQTAYAELLERCASADFARAFDGEGNFIVKTVKGRRYWYFQGPEDGQRTQRYVGPETPELLERIAQHRQFVDDQRDRRAIISALVRTAYLPRPPIEAGRVVAALADAGVFRLRAVMVGTVAFQTYSAMLGVRLPNAAIQTDDIDIAQDRNISIALDDATPPLLEVLQKDDPEFRAIPSLHGAASFSYRNARMRVDVLTPNRGAESDAPVRLKALGTDAQQLRFLDFLIRDPEPAVLLHDAGVLVNVPAPERYAVHKLIVAQRRSAGTAKAGKDLRQASALIGILIKRRVPDLLRAWGEAMSRGAKWRAAILDSLLAIDMGTRDGLLRVLGEPRSLLPHIKVAFADEPAHYDAIRAAVLFRGVSMDTPVAVAVSREALADHFNLEKDDNRSRVEAFHRHRAEIEAMAREKYLNWPIEDPAITILTSANVAKLKATPAARKRK